MRSEIKRNLEEKLFLLKNITLKSIIKMNKKLILNAQYGSAIKFKIPFDTQSDTATIEDLKKSILQRLEKLTQNMPPDARAKLPENFLPEDFILQDSNKFQLEDTDLVTDLL